MLTPPIATVDENVGLTHRGRKHLAIDHLATRAPDHDDVIPPSPLPITGLPGGGLARAFKGAGRCTVKRL